MFDPSQNNSPNTSVQPIFPNAHESHFLSSTSSAVDLTRKSRTSFFQVAKKVIEEVEANNQKDDVEESDKGEDANAEGYFNPDPEELPEDEASLVKKAKSEGNSNAYETYFKPKVFFKYFIMHVLYFFLMGPFIVILAPIFGMNVLRNQHFVLRCDYQAINQAVQFFMIVTFLVVSYAFETKGLQIVEVYMIIICVLIRIITICSKYAYRSACFIKLTETTILTDQELTGDFMLLGWRVQDDKIIEEELQAAILRLEIESSLFFFNFLGHPNPKLVEELSKKKNTVEQANNDVSEAIFVGNEKSKELVEPRPSIMTPEMSFDNHRTNVNTPENSVRRRMGKGEGIEEETGFASSQRGMLTILYKDKFDKAQARIVQQQQKKSESNTTSPASGKIQQSFSHFLEKKKFENSHLFGYNLAINMMKEARNVRYQHLGKSLVIISLIRAFIPTFYRLYLVYYKNEDIPVWTDKPYLIGLIIPINALFFFINSFILAVAVLDLNSRTFCLKQIGYLVSPKKLSHFKDRKLYPTVNIFDPITLKTWSNLRRLIVEYGRKYICRNNFNVTVTMIIYLFVLTILIVQVLGIVKTYDNPLLLIVLTYESAVFFAIFISIMVGAAFINAQFGCDKNLLKKNKMIVSDFYRLSKVYVGKNAIEPENYVYKEGLKILKKELGATNFEEKLVDRAEKLTAIIDDIIEELEFEEQNEPYTVLGIPVNYGLLKTAVFGLVSVLFALGQSLVS